MSYHLYKEFSEKYYELHGENKHYVVALMSLHQGELIQYEYYAASELAAANLMLDTQLTSMEAVHDYCAGCDSYISVLEIHDTLTE
jgi:hypothetical protein